MMQLIIRFIVNAIVLFLIAKFVPGFNHDVGIGTALIAAVVFGLVNALLGPILRLITLPLNWITHGLFAIVVNFVLFWLTVLIAPNFKTTGEINPWLAYLIGAVIMMIVATVMQSAAKTEQEAAVSDSP
jgi:putative membrane protein